MFSGLWWDEVQIGTRSFWRKKLQANLFKLGTC